MMGWWQDESGWNGMNWWGMSLMMILWIALIGLGIWAVIRFTQGSGRQATISPESPRAILDRRFASGDLDAQAYAEARRLLEHPGPTTHG